MPDTDPPGPPTLMTRDFESHPDLARLRAARRSRVADWVASAADPAILVLFVLAAVTLHSSPTVTSALGWALLAAAFCVGLPYLVLVLLIGRGLVLDRHVVVREQRRWPLLAALLSVLVGLAVLGWLGAPRPVLALVAAMLSGLAAMTALSHWYKASFHAAVAGGVAVILALVFGRWTVLPALPVLAVISWARVRAGRHTPGQVAAGLLVGAALAFLVFPAAARTP